MKKLSILLSLLSIFILTTSCSNQRHFPLLFFEVSLDSVGKIVTKEYNVGDLIEFDKER